jgi:AAA domain
VSATQTINLRSIASTASTAAAEIDQFFGDYPKPVAVAAAVATPVLTVARYAKAKALPENFLREQFHLEDGTLGVKMPYLNADGTLFRNKYRLTLNHVKGSDLMKWDSTGGDGINKTIPYGLWLMKPGPGQKHLFIVEGESNTQTLRFHNFAAIGISGANGWKDSFAELPCIKNVEIITVIQDPDDDGEKLVERLAQSPIQPKLRVLKMGLTPFKDVSELHLHVERHDAGAFKETLRSYSREPVPAVVKPPKVVANPEAKEADALVIEQMMDEAAVFYKESEPYNGSGLRWKVDECPFCDEPKSVVILQPDGKKIFDCTHKNTCPVNSSTETPWSQFRAYCEDQIGKRVKFQKPEQKLEQELKLEGEPDAKTNAKTDKKGKSTQTNGAKIISIQASDVVPVPINFLWKPYLQENALNGFYGNPSVGKGNTGIDCIARLTTAKPFSTEDVTDRNPVNVVVLAAEEGLEDTIVPRLMAAGADLKRVRIIKSIEFHKDGAKLGDRLITFQQDMSAIKEDLKQHPEEKFLFIDPITNYVGDINFNQDAEVRPVLTLLVQLAEELKITILIVGHFNKNSNVASAMDKPGGARAWVSVPRSVWGFFRNPDNDTQRVIANLKTNNAKESSTSLIFTIEERIIGKTPKGEPWGMPYVVWGEKTELSANEMIAAEHPEARRDTKGEEFLNKSLKTVRKAFDVYNEAEQQKISDSTLKRACNALGILKFKVTGEGWYWQHPSDKTPIPALAKNLNAEAEDRREREMTPELTDRASF